MSWDSFLSIGSGDLLPTVACIVLSLAAALALILGWRCWRRRQAQLARLQDREERLRLALWATGEYCWDLDVTTGQLDRLILQLDPSGAPGAMIGVSTRMDDVIHAEDLPIVHARLADYIGGKTSSVTADLRTLDPQGEWIWVRARGRTIAHDDAGKITRIAGTSIDITKTLLVERERRIAAQALRSMNEAVSALDDGFRFITINPAFSRITGYAADEIIGRNSSILDSPHHDEAFYGEIRRRVEQDGEWHGEIWQRKRDGEDFLCAISIQSIQDEVGKAALHVGVLEDITQKKHAEQELRYLANYDTLTNLPNRSLLSDRLARAIVRAQREGTRIAVLFIDLDRFKDINDALGHAAGDRILRATADRLQQTVGHKHTVARLGGDEFTIVLENLSTPEDADRAADGIVRSFELPLKLDDERELLVSPSIGISLFPDHARVPTTLLKQADTAMYQAKAIGRRTFMRYDPGMDAAIQRRAALSGALRKVLDRHELHLVYQPRLDLATARVTGVEALLRWTSSEHGSVSPTDFIPLAEENGLILEIGEWVLREACQTMQRWREQGIGDMSVSINVSVLQLLRGDFPEVVRQILADTGLPPSLLELELTESMLMANAGHTAAKLQALRELGVSLAIDDFGTGYSSLAYLKRLPFTTIKIDRIFIQDLPHDPEDEAIVGAIIAMAHALGLNVVAEGVETVEQMQWLADGRCNEIQGFWLARPLDPAACLGFIQGAPFPANGFAAPLPP